MSKARAKEARNKRNKLKRTDTSLKKMIKTTKRSDLKELPRFGSYIDAEFSLDPIMGANKLYHMVYVIRHVRSGCFYIGVHSDTSPNPILTTYFTSSYCVKNILEVDGPESFVNETCRYFFTKFDAMLHEDYLIRLNHPKRNPIILNKAYHIPQFDKSYEESLEIVEWDRTPYKGVFLTINPESPIFNVEFVSTIFTPVRFKR